MYVDYPLKRLYHTIYKLLNKVFVSCSMKTKKAIFYAILAAVLYALMTPVSKLLQVSVPRLRKPGFYISVPGSVC